jgi:hypothetical protein
MKRSFAPIQGFHQRASGGRKKGSREAQFSLLGGRNTMQYNPAVTTAGRP